MGLRVAELFAGVGGFRLGLERAGHRVVWWNQWEPSSKRSQHAFDCYAANFHPNEAVHPIHNTDISKVPAESVPDHDLMVGGFPCQDFSVASPLRHSKGLRGRKGALWWEINRILEKKNPPYVLLENVDRLLSSPKNRRGRDFAVLLSCLARLKYAAEWRVINAADYGEPQRRRRVFLFAAKLSTPVGKYMRRNASVSDYLTRVGFFAPAFPVVQDAQVLKARIRSSGRVGIEPQNASRRINHPEFRNAGVMASGRVWTRRLDPRADTPRPPLRSYVERNVDESYFVPDELLPAWKAAKDQKDIIKTARGGYKYRYKEGPVRFPDSLDEPARTLLTSEGRIWPSRSNHIIVDPSRASPPFHRVLTPEECEALMGFPRGHTAMLPRRWRYFVMGNAVMVGVARRIGERISAFLGAGMSVPVEAAGVTANGA